MIGWHAVPVLAEAMAKGIPADYAAAWPGIRRRALDFTTPTQDNALGIPFYDQLGYVPADLLFESVSRTLEYSYDDYAAARIARGRRRAGCRAPGKAQRQLAQRVRCQRGLCPPAPGRRHLDQPL
jgi:putative alpha-1,2-mannosidase